MSERIATETQAGSGLPSAPLPGSPTTELETLRAENERLKDHLRRCNSDWSRLKDWIIAGNGPQEYFRWLEAVKKNNGKGVEMFLDYINSLWRELSKAKSENNDYTTSR